ncbi:6734_t:CDS:1 [Dentiscutata heterogama]|uniref:6734_t:CDS:1 n=1 Tax=Dentiscutata heterogama TaxID=1316150 RepID=A0ACA9PDV1_9GLOM|nr:6734_t:CDS:1 [Dentiscutata heterogama]
MSDDDNDAVNKKKQTETFIRRIKGELPLVLPSNIPITPTNTNEEATTDEILNIWSNQLCNFFTKKKQHLVDLDSEEFLIRFDYSIIIYNKLKNEEYLSSEKQIISEMIKPTIPNFSNNEFTRKKKFHKNMFNLFDLLEKKKIPLEFCRNQLIGLGCTVNYFCESKDKEVEAVFKAFVEKCEKCYFKKQRD